MTKNSANAGTLTRVEIVCLGDVFGENEARYSGPVYLGNRRTKRGDVVDLEAGLAAGMVAKGLAQVVTA